jgi:signal transduction histidine kinase
LLPSSALGTALALVVMQIVLGCKHRYAGALASIASYISVGALAYVYLVDAGRTWAWSSQSATSVLPWILLSVSFACFAFIVLVEAEKMLQQILMAQTMDRTAATGDEFRAMPMLSDSDSSTAGGADANDIECDNRRLRGVNRNLEMIAYALSHDLRAPLRAIEGFTRTLAEDLGETIPEPAKRDMHEIRAGVDRMQRMVTQWLSFIRGDQSGVHREHIDLSDLAREIAAELRGNHLERKTAFQIEPGLTAFGDVQLIRELLQNLMGNAWKFTAANDLNAVIEVGAVGNDFHMNYFVRDNGAGFAAADALRLFTPFVRLHSSRQYEGTGIGLAIARKIIDAHGGRIWAEGQPDYGATFSFTLPKSAANASLAATLGTSNHCAAHDLRCAQ